MGFHFADLGEGRRMGEGMTLDVLLLAVAFAGGVVVGFFIGTAATLKALK